jgi:tetratricopeptide (TPR) repeat protein
MLYTFVSAHYEYLALAGPLALVAEILHRVSPKNAATKFAIPLALLLCFSAATLFYSWIYQSDMRMWQWNVRLNTAAWNARYNLAIACIAVGNTTDAERQLLAARDEYDLDARVHRTIGQFYVDKNQYDKALPEFRRSIELNPNDSVTFTCIGQMYLKTSQEASALAALAAAVEIAPNLVRTRYNYAQALARFAKRDAAKSQYEAALSLDPDSFDTLYNYGNLLLDMNNPAAALPHYQRALQLRPDNADAWFNMALALHLLHRDPEALAAQKQAAAIESAHPRTIPPPYASPKDSPATQTTP